MHVKQSVNHGEFKMLIKIVVPVRMLWLLLAFVSVIGVANAQEASSKPVDVVLALDNSGSMKHNDPTGSVKQAVADFARRLPPASQLGIVIFDQRVDLVMNLTKVSAPDFQSRLTESLRRVDYSGKWTDIPGGIDRAIYALNHDGRPDALRSVVFFTDGIVETGDSVTDIDRSKWLRENLTADAKLRGIRIFGVALTEGADRELIQVVTHGTGGESYRIMKSAEMAGAFEQISRQVKQDPQVSSVNPPQAEAASGSAATGPPPTRLWMVVLAGLAILMALIVYALRRTAPMESQLVPIADMAHLVDLGGHSGTGFIPISKRRVRIGRNETLNDVVIPQTTMSAQHAAIEFRDGSYFLRDLRSANGTFVNGKQMSNPDAEREVLLKSGDVIRFDAYDFIFNIDVVSAAVPTNEGIVQKVNQTILRKGPVPDHEAPKPKIAVAPRPNAAPVVMREEESLAGVASAPVLKGGGYCPVHSAWRASATCLTCGTSKCKQCMVEDANPPICLACVSAAKPSAKAVSA